MQYRIVISGYVSYAPNSSLLVDAQWNDYLASLGCFCQRLNVINFNGIALSAQNGQTVYDPNHSYNFLWFADTTELQLSNGDSLYSDNYGDFTYQIFEDVYIGTLTPTPTFTFTPTSTHTLTPTSTPTSTVTNTPIPSWYTGNDRLGAYGVKAFINTSVQEPFLDNISQSGQSNWVSIPMPYWVQAGWHYYRNWPGARPYIEWNMSNPPPGQIPHDFQEYPDDMQSWGTGKWYQVEWTSTTTWCGKAGDNPSICKDIGVSPPIRVYAHSEVHASSLNELDTLFSSVSFKDSNGDWHLFDQEIWWIQSPYNIEIYSNSQFHNYGP
jgi:hypothetical protein